MGTWTQEVGVGRAKRQEEKCDLTSLLVKPGSSLDFSFVYVLFCPSVPPQCQPLKTNMCKGLGYTYVQMPNFMGHKTQQDAGYGIGDYSPLVKNNCSPALRFFLCLLYVPPCVTFVNTELMIPPCRDVCQEARRGCEPILLAAGYRWSEQMNCTRFPTEDEKGKICLSKPKAKTTTGR